MGLSERIAEIMRAEIRLVSIDGEPCASCGDIVDYSFKVKDGCVEKCADKITELVFGAMATGDISVSATPNKSEETNDASRSRGK